MTARRGSRTDLRGKSYPEDMLLACELTGYCTTCAGLHYVRQADRCDEEGAAR